MSARTGIAGGEHWLAVRGFRHTEGSELPVCWTEVYITREFAAVGRLLQRHRGPIFHLIEDLFGQSLVEVHQEIAAALISPALASGLKVKAGTMALEVQRTYKLATGKVAQVAINTHPASRFRHSMTMRRVKDKSGKHSSKLAFNNKGLRASAALENGKGESSHEAYDHDSHVALW